MVEEASDGGGSKCGLHNVGGKNGARSVGMKQGGRVWCEGAGMMRGRECCAWGERVWCERAGMMRGRECGVRRGWYGAWRERESRVCGVL